MQRLLVGYKSSDMRSLAQLLDLIANKIDVPASQVAIEALVIELNRDDLSELGVDFSAASSGVTADFPPPQSGLFHPLQLCWTEHCLVAVRILEQILMHW